MAGRWACWRQSSGRCTGRRRRVPAGPGLAAAAGLAELPVQYADYAAWQRERLSGEVLARLLGYWGERLAGLEPLELPADRPRAAVRSVAGGSAGFEVPAEVARGLRRVAAARGASLFMTALAAFAVVLSRWSGQEDVAVGTPVADRGQVELEGLVGFFVNTLVLRVDLSGNPTFSELVDRVREAALGAFAHQELPFERLVEELAPERDLSRTPLSQVGFAMEEGGGAGWQLPGLAAEPFTVPDAVAKTDLSCVLGAGPDGRLRGQVAFAEQLFDEATARRLAGHLVAVMEEVAADPDVRVGSVAMLTPAERAQILDEFNDTAMPFADQATVHQLVQEQASRTPDAVAVACGDQQLTYRELNERANQLAGYLAGRGIGAETLVAVGMERGIELIVALLGIWKAGGAYLPLDPGYPAAAAGVHDLRHQGAAGDHPGPLRRAVRPGHQRPAGPHRRRTGRRSPPTTPPTPPPAPAPATWPTSSTPPAPPAPPRASSSPTNPSATSSTPARSSRSARTTPSRSARASPSTSSGWECWAALTSGATLAIVGRGDHPEPVQPARGHPGAAASPSSGLTRQPLQQPPRWSARTCSRA